MKDKIKVLFVDDDTDLGNLISSAFTSLGYEMHFQNSLYGIDQVINEFSPSIIVLDVEIGQDNGIKKAREIIAEHPTIPVLFVSSHTDISNISEGISAGGLNYIRKPFDLKELETYIVRFAKKEVDADDPITSFGLYALNQLSNELYYKNNLLKSLSPLEKNALSLFLKHKNNVVSQELLINTLWGKQDAKTLEASIHNLISKLRKNLNKDKQIAIITIKNKGYLIEVRE
ncbi:response regulator transcription factor [Massilibacteroides sp.]|uniref:response regulator transcription factor n=1 Tax=Massilibacteroides sp. TaxID=2034766 RepID=UPI002630F5B3|nr:response regulator transcription factor [Massilibacteroides sp.]MDD4516818.1 response regulator transcription factor [Massilibacteroides sp.]